MKDSSDSPKAQALLDAARAELAAKRRVRETRFAETVLGWESEEEARAADDFPQTVIGWDHPAAGGDEKKANHYMAALAAEEQAAAEFERQRTRRAVFIFLGGLVLFTCAFLLTALI